MSSFRRRALEAWRTRGQVTYGPRLAGFRNRKLPTDEWGTE